MTTPVKQWSEEAWLRLMKDLLPVKLPEPERKKS